MNQNDSRQTTDVDASASADCSVSITRLSAETIVVESLAVSLARKTVHVTRTTTIGKSPQVSIDCIVHKMLPAESLTDDERKAVVEAVTAWSVES